uniref:GIR1-like zinc ribbon domain-containing protein n=1 Tax=Oryza meridionalis TaxID=40149 RepID=A0A0E0F9L7_9ORYZ
MGAPSPPPPPPSSHLSHGLLRRRHRSSSSAAATAYSAVGSSASASTVADNAKANLAVPKEEHGSGRHDDGGAKEEHGGAGAEEKHGDDVEEEHGGGGSGFLGLQSVLIAREVTFLPYHLSSPRGTAPGTELVPPGTKLYRPLDRARSNGQDFGTGQYWYRPLGSMSRSNGNGGGGSTRGARLELQLNLSPPAVGMEVDGNDDSDSSSPTSCVSSDGRSSAGGSPGDKSPMVIGACTRCLMYCMVAKKDYPTCINCKQPSLVDLLQNQDAAAAAHADADKKRGGKRK